MGIHQQYWVGKLDIGHFLYNEKYAMLLIHPQNALALLSLILDIYLQYNVICLELNLHDENGVIGGVVAMLLAHPLFFCVHTCCTPLAKHISWWFDLGGTCHCGGTGWCPHSHSHLFPLALLPSLGFKGSLRQLLLPSHPLLSMDFSLLQIFRILFR